MKRICRFGLFWFGLLAVALMAQDPEPTQEQPELPQESRFNYGLWTDLLYADGDWQQQDAFFNVSRLYLFGKYDFPPSSWSAFAEVAFERELDLQLNSEDEVDLERAYLEYRWRPELALRFGKFNTQAGIIKPIHWRLTLDSVFHPIMEANSYVPAKSTGVEIFGRRTLERHEVNYSLALSYSENEITDDAPIDRATGAVFDVNVGAFQHFKYGVSVAFYRDPKDKDRSVTSVLPYGEIHLLRRRLLLRSEMLQMKRDSGPDVQAWYAKAKWRFTVDTYANLRFDIGDDEQSLQGLERRSWTATLGHKWTSNWRSRVEVASHRLEDDANTTFTQWAAWLSWTR